MANWEILISTMRGSRRKKELIFNLSYLLKLDDVFRILEMTGSFETGLKNCLADELRMNNFIELISFGNIYTS